MATITLNIYQNQNKQSKGYQKWYGRVKHSTPIDAATLCDHVAMDSGLERADVATVFDAVLKQIKEQLCGGHPIKIEGLGTFKIGIKSKGVSTLDIKKSHPTFDPETDDPRKYLSGRQVESSHILFTPSDEIKTLLSTVKLVTDKTEWAAQLEKEKNV